MNGFNIAEAGHAAVILSPQSISGGKTAQAFSMKGHKHASILVAAGALAGAGATLVLSVCSDAADNAVAIPFNYYYQGAGAGNDVPSVLNSATAAGLALAAGIWPAAGGLVIVEIDANELTR